MNTVREALRAATDALKAAGVETPGLDARALAGGALSLSAARLIDGGGALLPEDLRKFSDAVARRVAGEPVSRILGHREFWGLDFVLTAETLTPRPDTETVVQAALAQTPRPDASILDLGTGSGCILIALLSELPKARGLGIDLSPGAAAAARANAERLGLGARASFAAGRWGDALAGRFDLVVSNPPYIESAAITGLDCEVRSHDPALALDGGADGLDAYREIAGDLSRLLAPGGVAVLELGVGQLPSVAAIAERVGLQVAGATSDLADTPRALALRAQCDR